LPFQSRVGLTSTFFRHALYNVTSVRDFEEP